MHYILYRIQYIQFAPSNVFFFISCLFVLFGSWVMVGMLMLNEMARGRERDCVFGCTKHKEHRCQSALQVANLGKEAPQKTNGKENEDGEKW